MIVAPGATDVISYFHLRKTSDGTDATGLTPADFDLTYVRSGAAAAAKVDATALTTSADAHTDNKVIEVDATNMPGVYRVDFPDAAFAAGAREVVLYVKVATAFGESLRVELSGAAAMVNAEVVDALNVDTYAEPGQGAPAATATLAAKINYLFKAWRNKVDSTTSQYKLYADDSTTVDQKAAQSDDGTTFTRAKIGSGP